MQAQGLVVAELRRLLRPTATGKAVSEGQALAMRPEFTNIDFRRNEIGTRHHALLTW
jgi:hypothetical protein